MGKDNDPPPPPDMSGITKAIQQSVDFSTSMSKEQLAWAKEQFAQNKEVSDLVIGTALKRQEALDGMAAKDRARYESVFQPLEDQLAYDAQYWASPEKKEHAAGRAEADVAGQFQQARNTAQQRLEQFGVDPSQTRAGALDLQSRIAEAAAQSAAGNQARDKLDAQQLALRSEAINVGKGYPGQIAGQYGLAGQQGNQAANTGLATTASGASTMGTAPQYAGMAQQGIGTWGNIVNQGYQNQLSAWNAQQQASSGIGSALGGIAGLAASFIPGFGGGGSNSSQYFTGTGALYQEGGDVPSTALPMPEMVPPQASPSMGMNVDDVPARLTPGEFVIPKDVMAWKGQEWIQKEIMKARKKSSTPEHVPARPTRALPEG